jgi:hypothetical protein
MKELEKRLKKLREQGYEQISIIQILNWMSEIRRNNTKK